MTSTASRSARSELDDAHAMDAPWRMQIDDVTVWADETWKHVQLFTGDPLPDVARRALAVEPMTCPPNAFRTGEDLIRLEPGERFTGTWGIVGRLVKKRLDVLLVERGLAESRTQAQAFVMAGLVPGYDKPGQQVDEDAELSVVRGPAYVSRGGEKLAHALDALGVDPAGLDVLDVGASTGGFTDVLLQRGARARDRGRRRPRAAAPEDPRRPARRRDRADERARADRAAVRAAADRLRRLVHLRADGVAAGARARGARLAGGRAREAAVRGGPRGRRRRAAASSATPRFARASCARSPMRRSAGRRRSPAS